MFSIRISDIFRNFIKLYLLLFFFVVPLEYNNYLTIGFLSLSFVFVVAKVFCLKKQFRKKEIVSFGLLLLFLTVILVFSKYSKINAILVFSYLAICYFAFSDSCPNRYEKPKFDWFYWLSLIVIVTKLTTQILTQGFLMDRFELGTAMWDSNVTGVALFCFFVYCDKKHPDSMIWKVLAILLVFFLRGSRGTILLAFLFIALKIFILIKSKTQKRIEFIKPIPTKKVALFIIACLTLFVAFSFFWTYVISNDNVSSYHEGINDNSNAVRFRANVYVIKLVLANPIFLICGYDNDIQYILGDIDANEFTYFENYRLVQSHNSILNMLLKNGVLFTLVYFTTRLIVFKKRINKPNLAYFIPIFVISMILHSLFITDFLLFFLMSLTADDEPKGIIQTSKATKKVPKLLSVN